MPTFDLVNLKKRFGDCINYEPFIKLFRLKGKTTYNLPLNKIKWAMQKIEAVDDIFFLVGINSTLIIEIKKLAKDAKVYNVTSFGAQAIEGNLRTLHVLQKPKR